MSIYGDAESGGTMADGLATGGVSGHGSCVCGCGGTPVPRHVRILNWVAPVDADAVSLAAVLVPPQGKVSLSTAGLTAKLQEPGTKCAS